MPPAPGCPPGACYVPTDGGHGSHAPPGTCMFCGKTPAVQLRAVDGKLKLLSIADAAPAHGALGSSAAAVVVAGRLGEIIALSRTAQDKLRGRDGHGRTAVHLAAREGRIGPLAFLLSVDPAAVAVRDGLGLTPLHLAALNGHAPAVELLSRAEGVELEATTTPAGGKGPGRTALELAVGNGHADAAAALCRRGAAAPWAAWYLGPVDAAAADAAVLGSPYGPFSEQGAKPQAGYFAIRPEDGFPGLFAVHVAVPAAVAVGGGSGDGNTGDGSDSAGFEVLRIGAQLTRASRFLLTQTGPGGAVVALRGPALPCGTLTELVDALTHASAPLILTAPDGRAVEVQLRCRCQPASPPAELTAVPQPENPAMLLPQCTRGAAHWRATSRPPSPARLAELARAARVLQRRYRARSSRAAAAAVIVQAAFRGHAVRRRFAAGLRARVAARAATTALASLEAAAAATARAIASGDPTAADAQLASAVGAVAVAFADAQDPGSASGARDEGRVVLGTAQALLGEAGNRSAPRWPYTGAAADARPRLASLGARPTAAAADQRRRMFMRKRNPLGSSVVRARPHAGAEVVAVVGGAPESANVVAQLHETQEAAATASGVWVRLANPDGCYGNGQAWLLAAPPLGSGAPTFWTPIPNVDYVSMGRSMLANSASASGDGYPWVINIDRGDRNHVHAAAADASAIVSAEPGLSGPRTAHPVTPPGEDTLATALARIARAHGGAVLRRVATAEGLPVPPTLLHALLRAGCATSALAVGIDVVSAPVSWAARRDAVSGATDALDYATGALETIDAGGRTALLLALQLGDVDGARALLEAGAAADRRRGPSRRAGLAEGAAAACPEHIAALAQPGVLHMQRGDQIVADATWRPVAVSAPAEGWAFGLNTVTGEHGWFALEAVAPTEPAEPPSQRRRQQRGGCSEASRPLAAAVDLWFARLVDGETSGAASVWGLVEALVARGASVDAIDADGHTLVTRMLRIACGEHVGLDGSPLGAVQARTGWQCGCGFVNAAFAPIASMLDGGGLAFTDGFELPTECEACGAPRHGRPAEPPAPIAGDGTCDGTDEAAADEVDDRHVAAFDEFHDEDVCVDDETVAAACRALAGIGCSLTAADAVWETPLHVAAHLGSRAVAATLMSAGADAGIPAVHRPSGCTALAFAALVGSGELFDDLVAHAAAQAAASFAAGDDFSGHLALPGAQLRADVRVGGSTGGRYKGSGATPPRAVKPQPLLVLLARHSPGRIFGAALRHLPPSPAMLTEVVKWLLQRGDRVNASAAIEAAFQHTNARVATVIGSRTTAVGAPPLQVYAAVRKEVAALVTSVARLAPITADQAPQAYADADADIGSGSSVGEHGGVPAPPPAPSAADVLRGFSAYAASAAPKWNPELAAMLERTLIKRCIQAEIDLFIAHDVSWKDCEVLRSLPWTLCAFAGPLVSLLRQGGDSGGPSALDQLLDPVRANGKGRGESYKLVQLLVDKLPADVLRPLAGWLCRYSLVVADTDGMGTMLKLLEGLANRAAPLGEEAAAEARECGLIPRLRRIAVDLGQNQNKGSARAGRILRDAFPDDAIRCTICDCATTMQPVCVQSGGEHYHKMPCDCTYCGDCLAQWITATVDGGSARVRCPTDGCKFVLYGDDVKRLGTPEAYARFVELQNRDGAARLAEVARDPAMKGWLRANARVCPSCKVIVEKSQGCNQMLCACGERFQWNLAQDPVTFEEGQARAAAAEGARQGAGNGTRRQRSGWLTRLLHWGGATERRGGTAVAIEIAATA